MGGRTGVRVVLKLFEIVKVVPQLVQAVAKLFSVQAAHSVSARGMLPPMSSACPSNLKLWGDLDNPRPGLHLIRVPKRTHSVLTDFDDNVLGPETLKLERHHAGNGDFETGEDSS